MNTICWFVMSHSRIFIQCKMYLCIYVCVCMIVVVLCFKPNNYALKEKSLNVFILIRPNIVTNN